MTPDRRIVLPALFACLALLGGCKALTGRTCNNPQGYEDAHSVAPLKIPVGLDAPNTRNAMRIPDLNEPVAPRGPDAPWLGEPPPEANVPRTPPPKT